MRYAHASIATVGSTNSHQTAASEFMNAQTRDHTSSSSSAHLSTSFTR